eukprot:2712139-Amphidinium_carterae.1
MPNPSSRLLYDDQDQARLSHLTYADDLLQPLEHAHPAQLLQDMRSLAEFTIRHLSIFHLKVNMKKDKSGAVVSLTTPQAKSYWQDIKDKSFAVCDYMHLDLGTLGKLHITDVFKYLGSLNSAKGTAAGER